MNIFGFEFSLQAKSQTLSIDQLIARLDEIFQTVSGESVTPDSAMEAPTIQAIVQAASRRIAALPVGVIRVQRVNGRMRHELLPDHPITRLLRRPNNFQNRSDYWLDATSMLVRWGNYYAWKNQVSSGRVMELIPLQPSAVTVEQERDFNVIYRYSSQTGQRVFRRDEILHARGPARNTYKGDSPVTDIRETIALEIAAEKFGAAFFGNGAAPFLVFKYVQGNAGFKTDEERDQFKKDFDNAYKDRRRFRSLVLPKGMDMADPVVINNERNQFLETRRYQRNVIAGAFNVPPHLVGDLEKGTFNNIEQQDIDFVLNVVMPLVEQHEAAMDASLLSEREINEGLTIRFDMDAVLRADFKSRQEGRKIQREMGIINPNEWRERERMNPISEEDGGETYWQEGPSGQGQDTGTGGTSDAA